MKKGFSWAVKERRQERREELTATQVNIVTKRNGGVTRWNGKERNLNYKKDLHPALPLFHPSGETNNELKFHYLAA